MLLTGRTAIVWPGVKAERSWDHSQRRTPDLSRYGAFMDFSDEIRREYEKSDAVTHFVIEGEPMPRVRFGDEQNRMSLMNCPECYSAIGSFHMLGCTVEQCPLCDGKAYDCACSYEKRPREYLR